MQPTYITLQCVSMWVVCVYTYKYSVCVPGVCCWDGMTVPCSVLLCVLRAAAEFMLFCPSSLPRILAILGKIQITVFQRVVGSCGSKFVLNPPAPSLRLPVTSPISLICLPYTPTDTNLSVSLLSLMECLKWFNSVERNLIWIHTGP